MHSNIKSLLLVLSLSVLLASCGGKVKVAAGLVDQVARPIGVKAKQVELNSNVVEGLATAARVDPEVIEQAAESTETARFWPRALDSLYQYNEQSKGPLRSAIVETACKALKGEEVTEEEFANTLAEKGLEAGQSQLRQLWNTLVELYSDLEEDLQSEDPRRRASVAILCATVDVVGG